MQPSGPRRRRVHRRRRHRIRRAAGIILLVVLVPTAWSYARALTAPGSAPWTARTVEWMKDHGGRGIVLTVERWWYTHHPPPVGGTPAGGLPYGADPTSHPRPPEVQATDHLPGPADITPIADHPLPREGVWQPTGRAVQGIPAMYTAFLRPDPVHTSLVAGVAWMDTKLLRGVLVAGTQSPGGSGWRWGAEVPPSQRADLVTTFNSGFLLKDSRSGYYSEGRMVAALQQGAASLVIYKDGTMTVGAWGRDVTMSPDVASVRQNLRLIVNHGQQVAGLATDPLSTWGATLGNQVLVWRSGVGVDRNGGLIYAGGPGLSISSLANLLAKAGAVKAMELDINTDWVSLNWYRPAPNSSFNVAAHKLLPAMVRSPDRYLVPDERDFFAMFLRPGLTVP